jgi:hypothetical protein
MTDRRCPIRARGDFYDVPRLFVVRDGERDLVFDSAFRDDLDEYDDDFVVFAHPSFSDEELAKGFPMDWCDQAIPIARLPVGSVHFDPSRRASIAASVLDLVRQREADPALSPIISSIDQLRAYDDPSYSEQPPDFDEPRERAGVEALIARISRAFRLAEWSKTGQPSLHAEIGFPQIQDASHFATLQLPAAATDGGQELLLRTSRFGPMLAIAAPSLETPRSATDRNRLAALGAEAGYRIVFADLLSRHYDGANEYLTNHLYADHPERLTWWIRFFDWI